MQIVEVVFTFLQEDADRFFLSLADHCVIVMATSDVGKTADVTQNLEKRIRAFPRNRPCTDAARTNSGNCPILGIFRNVVGGFERWKQLFH